ncbi:MAG: D-alanine--D-alanine ligase [Erysipelotrichaceae bacterium]|jgi:D-alanine---D-serine ligase|nr:D-alanine--D-alanine ligase [Erysipelotrichaceae bacterium]
MKKIKLAVIFGGQSSEYPVSLHSTASVLRQIDTKKYEILKVGISQDGKWYTYYGDIDALEHDQWLCADMCKETVLSCSQAYKGFLELEADGTYHHIAVDCILPILHGKNGEDGTIQGLFELSGISYVGCGHMSSAICMDKEMTHIVAEHAGIPCAPYICVYKRDAADLKKVYEDAKAKLGLPIFIKPANAGSSFGISKVDGFEEFAKGMSEAFYHDGKGKVILETTIEGFEIGCAVMGNDVLTIGSVDEIEITNDFFDYEGKYEMVNSHIYCPARIDEELFQKAQKMAADVYRALNCQGMTRVDMFVTPQHTIVFNELNTIPGFTSTSRYPSMMKEIGIEFSDLIDRLIALALEK